MRDMDTPRYTRLAAALPATVPFVGPETQERARGRAFRARLGANENVFGPRPAPWRRWRRAAGDAWMYGDPENHDLKAALAARHGVAPGNVVVGEGIDGLLGLLVRLLVEPGDAVVTSDGAYPTFAFHVAGFGGVLHKAPYRDDAEDPQALLDLARATGAKMVYLANPDNPMGSWHPGRTVAAMLDDLPPGCLLVLDEAYVEFAPEGTAAPVAADDPRVIRFRTFSKAYGLAGLRVGYGLAAPGLARAFDRIRNHFGVTRIGQAGALAALADDGWLAQTLAKVAEANARIARIAADNSLAPLPTATNFIAIDAGRDGAFAQRLLAELATRDIFVRKPFVAPQDRCIRVAAGTPADLDLFAETLPGALAAAR